MPTVLWCNRCGLPNDCPEHPGGVPVMVGEDDVDYRDCDCPAAQCVCPDPVYGPQDEE